MSNLEIIVRTVAGFGLLGANAFFVATEFAMTRVRQFDESEFEGHPALEKAWEMTDELEIYLTACQVGITVTSILLGVVFEPGVSAMLEPLLAHVPVPVISSHAFSVVISVAVIQLMHTVWAEQSPTYLGVEVPKTVVRYCAYPLFWWTTLMYPFIHVGDVLAKSTLGVFGITMDRSWTSEGDNIESTRELRTRLRSLLNKGKIPNEQRSEVINAFEIIEKPTREIMVHRDEIVALSTEDSPRKNYERMTDRHHARFPLVGESLDDFIGIVYVPSLFPLIEKLKTGEASYTDVAVSPLEVEADLPVSELVDRFQSERQELALVRENGRVVGLVTTTDAFEAITGELEDPFDARTPTPDAD